MSAYVAYSPSAAMALLVGVAAMYFARFATTLLTEGVPGRDAFIGVLGMGIVASVALVTRALSAPPLVTNLAAAVTAVICLLGFVRMTARSRGFDRITRLLLASSAQDAEAAVRALHDWLEQGRPKPGESGEYVGNVAKCALALLVTGRHQQALALLDGDFDRTQMSAAERSQLTGTRALAYELSGQREGAEQVMEKERAAQQDFISKGHFVGYDAWLAALRGEGKTALAGLKTEGAHAGDSCVARWARMHALAAEQRPEEAKKLLLRQRQWHGDGGLVPVLRMPGPASAIAKDLLAKP